MMMPQLNPLAVNLMAGMAAICCTAAVATPAIAQPPQPTFADLCAAFQGISNDWGSLLYGRPYAWQTVDALMAALPTNDCQRAGWSLATVTSLWAPQLETTYLPTNGLMVDFPIGVDLHIIAIATPNLIDLNLNGHVIPDLAPITALSQLHTLRVANTQLQDISPLSGLPQLTTLDISYNQINSIAAIGNMSTIRSLNVSYNPLTDISPIGKILTPTVEREWQLLDLSGIVIDYETCPENLGDICGTSPEGDF